MCAPCHENNQLNVKYGLPTNIMDSWRHSYHGMKSTDGDPKVANCSSCHRAHLILPASDARSSIAPANVQATCARCHASITPELAAIEIHKTTGVFLNRTGRAVRTVYVVAIIVIIGSMLVYWLIDLSKRIRVLNHGPQVRRMRRDELWQHTFLMVSFTVPALTGFAFHYSGSWWASGLFGWPGGFALRRRDFRQFVLAKRPKGEPDDNTLRLETEDLPTPGKGQMLRRNLGFERAPSAFVGLLRGEAFGKRVIHLND